MIKRILLALSGSPYTQSAIEHGVELARIHDAELAAVTIVNLAELSNVGPVPLGGGAAASELAQHRIQITEQKVDESVEAFVRACQREGITHHVLREEGRPLVLFERCSRYHDLIVTGLRDLFEYGVVHHPDDTIIRLVKNGIRPIVASARHHRPVRRAFIAYNGSKESSKAMRHFVQTSPWGEVQVKIAHFEKRKDDPQQLLRDAQRYCKSHGIDADTEFINEDPADTIIQRAGDWNADVIVLGSTGRSRLTGYVVGDTVMTAVRHSDIPLYLSA